MENYIKCEMYLYETGEFLPKNDREYECYSNVYDKEHAYYDLGQNLILAKDLDEMKQVAKNYVSIYKNSYVVITYQGLWDLTQEEIDNEDFDSLDISYCDYNVENVVYSIMSDEYGNIKEDFIIK